MTKKFEFEKKYRDQVLRCSSCGFCRADCPVFGATMRSAYNARGKMLLLKEVMNKKIELNDELIETLFQCTTCANCSAHCPSGVEVPEIIKQARKDLAGLDEKVNSRTLAGRYGESQDLAGAAVFLASAASDFVTGVALPVDGGYSISL